MPGPAIYIVVGVVGAVAAGIAFKEFVYDPHVAPKIDEWTQAYTAFLRERRRERAAAHTTMYNKSPSDEDSSEGDRTGVELESILQREMEHLGESTSLRRRNVARDEPSILEDPIPSISYAPLSPRSLSSSSASSPPNPFSDPTDIALPLGKLTLFSRGSSSQREPPVQQDNQSSHGNPNNISVLPPSPTSSAPRSLTPPFVVASDQDQSSSSHGSTPFPEAADSRSGTPFTDGVSSHSFADFRSGVSFSDVARSEFSYASDDYDVEEPHPASSFIIPSHSSVSTSSLRTTSDDFAEHRQDAVRSPHSTSGRLSDEDWDHVSEA
ncbi:hypothetical protein M422DRAFT_23354 [Sphaerobolus stellatus SS14]|nr:hypothetical protein M422DRAFT_23354 [Sphaerobolus stellatus SS14]